MPEILRTDFFRFVLNGLAAAAVHFAVLSFLMEVVEVPLAALANFLAAVVGISVSFIGNRYFVFRGHTGTFAQQFVRFAGLYLAVACLHGLVLYLWTDTLRLDYRVGFVVASALQVAISYFGNKLLVFHR